MPGLRIHHPELRSAVIEIPVPPKGPRGRAKRVQVVVDDTGHAIVSDGVWAELQLATSNGSIHQFIIVNQVANPPDIGVSLDTAPDTGRPTYLVEQEALREIAPAGVTARVIERLIPPNVRSN